MEFEVFVEGEPIKHPVTGKVLGVEKTRTGRLRVTEVQANLAFARVAKEEQGQAVSVGQRVVSRVVATARTSGYVTPFSGSTTTSSTGKRRHSRTRGNPGRGCRRFLQALWAGGRCCRKRVRSRHIQQPNPGIRCRRPPCEKLG